MGKILPYLITSIIACTLISVYFGVPLAFVFAIPVIIFLFSAQHFIAVISRSYREATFLLLVASLFITIYVFIPAVFSGSIPISKISPITLMLEYRDGRIEPESTVLSFSHLLLMSAVLFYLTSKSMNIDILYERSVLSKFLALSQDIIKRPWHSFVCASFSIPFAFMIEFFLIILVFLLPPALAIPVLILAIALVEEAIKGLLISARPQFLFTIATALGFFTGEKILVLFSVIREYSIIFLGHYLILPLFLHLSTAILFRYSLRHGFGISLTLATLLHFTYNYLVVMFFAP
jgi:ABC-type Na+ efflux pump permease subunit